MKKSKAEEAFEKILTLQQEKHLRCGDGTGNIPSHSVNCRCKEIDKEIQEVKVKDD